MVLSFFWVDAFTDRVFKGNPAAVCPLDAWLDDTLLQTMARQHGLSETAYFVRVADRRYRLRWFTPVTEVDLCGHATLASAHVLFSELGLSGNEITFDSRSGPLLVSRAEENRLCLNFPARTTGDAQAPESLTSALRQIPETASLGQTCWLAVFPKARAMPSHRPRRRAGLGFRIALFRAGCGNSRGPSDGVGALCADALLGNSSGQGPASRKTGVPTRRRTLVHLGR